MTDGPVSGPTGPRMELNQYPAGVGPRGAPGAAKALEAEYASFTKFKQTIDGLIRDLKGSPADHDKLGQEPLTRAAISGAGSEWGAASSLFDSYNAVIKDLEGLSKLLSDSMDAMGIAVVASHKGYDNIDADIRDRVRRIQAEMHKHYDEQPPGLQSYGKDPSTKYDHGDNEPTNDQQPPTGDGSDEGDF